MLHLAWVLVTVINGHAVTSEPTISEACILQMHSNYDHGLKQTYCVNREDGTRINPVPLKKGMW